ncbi:MAG: Na(+)-translocating NADH-quinone reductase subunit C [Deltaproteobacteria bacterium]|nr:Na(+)-translocating NADH-quinone reductase subunit C [Deltaproteobacteria bacterium]
MSQPTTSYTVMFAAGVCLICSLFVSGAAVALKDKQDANKVLDKQKKVLAVAGLIEEGASPSASEVDAIFAEKISAQVVDMKTKQVVNDPSFDFKTYDAVKASKDPATSLEVAPNKAKVGRLPARHVVYCVKDGGACSQYIFPVEGKGLWSTMYGFLSLEKDLNTVRGITFYAHGETPGLGGEIDNAGWKALWPGRKVYKNDGSVALKVVKGQAGDVKTAPHNIDGLSGATLTSNGVTYLVDFWLGPDGFKGYIDNLKSGSAG